MPEKAERSQIKAAESYIDGLKGDPNYSTIFGLRDVTGRRNIPRTILRRMLVRGDDLFIWGPVGGGKTANLWEFANAYREGAQKLGINRRLTTHQWDKAKEQTNSPGDYDLLTSTLRREVEGNPDGVRIGEIPGVGFAPINVGVEFFHDLARQAREKGTTKGEKHIMVMGMPEDIAMQILVDDLREGIRHTPESENVVEALEKINIYIRGAQSNEAWDDALRKYAEYSGLQKHMELKRRELEELKYDWRLFGGEEALEEIDGIKFPYDDYSKFAAYVFDREGTEDIGTATRFTRSKLRASAAQMLYIMREELLIPRDDRFAVFNIPKPNPDGSLTIPPPISFNV